MANNKIHFFEEDIVFTLPQKQKHREWLTDLATTEGFKIKELNYIFCTDEYLHKINVEYLDHDTLTDIITFDNSEIEGKIEGDIFVSIERVRENAETFQTPFDNELKRVLAHGLLHLCGYKDKTAAEEIEMRQKESFYIQKTLHVKL
jgi:probable rRNA maturation factor